MTLLGQTSPRGLLSPYPCPWFPTEVHIPMLDTGDPQEFGKEKMGRQFRKKKKKKETGHNKPV
jgi:hypothetical protein